jgi:alkylation response protein AidB-like acyl-CoA dehydrogenase
MTPAATVTAPGTATSPAAVLDAAAQLAPSIRDRAAEIESSRRLPTDLLDALKRAGCFRIVHPRSHGGIGADLVTALTLYESLARADGSTGWTVMIGSAAWCDLAGLPRPSFDQLFAADQDVIIAGAFNPTGSISAEGSAYRVAGRWSFASGCEHATWLYGNCVEGVVDGVPQLRSVVFAPDDVVIEDTWDAMGLRGTGSHHFRVDGLIVDAARTLVPLVGEPCIDEPFVRCPIPSLIALGIASVAIGIGRGALDEVIEVAQTKVPLLSHGPLATSPAFQDQLARADTDLRAARTLLHDLAGSTWTTAEAGGAFTLEDRGVLRSAAAWIVERAEAAVAVAHRAGGGGAIYADSPLQRRLRDVQTLRQHFLVRAETFTPAGAILAGQDPAVMVF